MLSSAHRCEISVQKSIAKVRPHRIELDDSQRAPKGNDARSRDLVSIDARGASASDSRVPMRAWRSGVRRAAGFSENRVLGSADAFRIDNPAGEPGFFVSIHRSLSCAPEDHRPNDRAAFGLAGDFRAADPPRPLSCQCEATPASPTWVELVTLEDRSVRADPVRIPRR